MSRAAKPRPLSPLAAEHGIGSRARRVKEFFLASLLVRVPCKRGCHAWTREVLRARTPQALLRMIDGRKHIAYASNGVNVIRIELINTGTTILAPIAPSQTARRPNRCAT